MKNTIKVLAIISIICFLVVSVCTCGSAEKLKYYAEKDNYITQTSHLNKCLCTLKIQ